MPKALAVAVQNPVASNPAWLVPASRRDLAHFRAVMLGSFKIPSDAVMADPAAHVSAMAAELGCRKYPNVVLLKAYRRALGTEKWLPDTATMIGLCQAILRDFKAKEQRRRIMETEQQRQRAECERQEGDRAKQAAAKSVLENKRPALAQHWNDAVFALATIFGYVRLDEWVEAVIAEEPWAIAAAERVIEIPDPEGLLLAWCWTPGREDHEWDALHRPSAADRE